MLMDNLLLVGIFVLLCGVLVICVLGAVLLGVLVVRLEPGEERGNAGEMLGDGKLSRADSVLFKQWDNLLGYNGREGDGLDE